MRRSCPPRGPQPGDPFDVDPSVLNNVKDDKRSSNGDTSDNTSSTYVLTANWNTGIGTLTSISGYNKFKYDELCDCDFTGANAPQRRPGRKV